MSSYSFKSRLIIMNPRNHPFPNRSPALYTPVIDPPPDYSRPYQLLPTLQYRNTLRFAVLLLAMSSVTILLALLPQMTYCYYDVALTSVYINTDNVTSKGTAAFSRLKELICDDGNLLEEYCPGICSYIDHWKSGGILFLVLALAALVVTCVKIPLYVRRANRRFMLKWVVFVMPIPLALFALGWIIWNAEVKIWSIRSTSGDADDAAVGPGYYFAVIAMIVLLLCLILEMVVVRKAFR